MLADKLISGHRSFRQTFDENRAFFERLANQGQHPLALWIGCSDSRVVPEQIMGARPGDLFVMRNVANIVPPADKDNGAMGAVLEYAVLHLRVPEIVVCGHTDCGGIRALASGVDAEELPGVARWLTHAQPALASPTLGPPASGQPALGQPALGPDQHLAAVLKNVILQMRNLETHACVRAAVAEGNLRVHGWLYDLGGGALWAYDPRVDAWDVL